MASVCSSTVCDHKVKRTEASDTEKRREHRPSWTPPALQAAVTERQKVTTWWHHWFRCKANVLTSHEIKMAMVTSWPRVPPPSHLKNRPRASVTHGACGSDGLPPSYQNQRSLSSCCPAEQTCYWWAAAPWCTLVLTAGLLSGLPARCPQSHPLCAHVLSWDELQQRGGQVVLAACSGFGTVKCNWNGFYSNEPARFLQLELPSGSVSAFINEAVPFKALCFGSLHVRTCSCYLCLCCCSFVGALWCSRSWGIISVKEAGRRSEGLWGCRYYHASLHFNLDCEHVEKNGTWH